MVKKQIAAIDFGTGKITTVIARSGGIDRLELLGSGTVAYDGFKDGDWITAEQMVQRVHDSISEAEREAGTKISELYVGVPGEFVRVCTAEAEIPLGEAGVTNNDIDLVQDAAAEKLHIADIGGVVMHRSPAWFQIDSGKKTMDPAGHGQLLRCCTSFIVADPNFISDMREILGALNLTILGFLSPSLGEALLLLSIDDRDRVSVLLDCGYLSTEISVICGEAIIYHAILQEGGGYITADLATQLRIPMRAAEQLKRSFIFNPDEFDADTEAEVKDARGHRMSFPAAEVRECVEKSMSGLCEKLKMTLDEDIAPMLGARSQIYLTGGGVGMMRGVREYLGGKLGHAIKAVAPKTSKLNSPIYSSVLGLVDLIFDSIDREEPDDSGFAGKLTGFLKKKR